MARSGVSSAVLLKNLGSLVTLQDLKKESEFDSDVLKNLRNKNITLYLGKNPDDIIKDFELIVISPGIPLELPFLDIARKENIPIIGEIELGFLVSKSPIISITGTNGKTTTTSLVGEIIKEKYKNTIVVGNIGFPFTEKAAETTLDGFTVLEASSFQLETIEKFKPHISAVLNISPDHLDRHKTLNNYIAAKKRIFENQDENDFLILNYEDPETKKMASETKTKVMFFSSKREIPDGVYLTDNTIFYGKEKIIKVSELKILGLHNYENVMASILISICAKVPLDVIRKVLLSFEGVPHRIEFSGEKNGIAFYNDSKGTNPDSAIKAILAMERPIILIAGGYEKNSDFTEWIGYFKDRVKFAFILGEVKDRLASDLVKLGFNDFKKVDTFEEAFKGASNKASSGDCVLLSPACASWGMFRDYEERGDVFKEMVLKLP